MKNLAYLPNVAWTDVFWTFGSWIQGECSLDEWLPSRSCSALGHHPLQLSIYFDKSLFWSFILSSSWWRTSTTVLAVAHQQSRILIDDEPFFWNCHHRYRSSLYTHSEKVSCLTCHLVSTAAVVDSSNEKISIGHMLIAEDGLMFRKGEIKVRFFIWPAKTVASTCKKENHAPIWYWKFCF